MRLEVFLEGERRIVRADLPGVDPDKDISVTVDDGLLASTASAGPRSTTSTAPRSATAASTAC